MTDENVDPEVMLATETQETILRIVYRVESLQSLSFIAISWGIALEDGTMGISLSGWRSVEDRPFFLPSSFRVDPHSCKG